MTRDSLDAVTQARALFGDVAEGRWEKTYQYFRQDMRVHHDAERLARAWVGTANAVGGFERLGEPSTRQSRGQTVVSVPLIFGAGKGIGRVSVDPDGKVTRLSVHVPRRRLSLGRIRFFGFR